MNSHQNDGTFQHNRNHTFNQFNEGPQNLSSYISGKDQDNNIQNAVNNYDEIPIMEEYSEGR